MNVLYDQAQERRHRALLRNPRFWVVALYVTAVVFVVVTSFSRHHEAPQTPRLIHPTSPIRVDCDEPNVFCDDEGA